MAKLLLSFIDLKDRLIDDRSWRLSKISHIDGKLRDSYCSNGHSHTITYILNKISALYIDEARSDSYKLIIEFKTGGTVDYMSINLLEDDNKSKDKIYLLNTIECCDLLERLLTIYEDYAGYPFDDIIYEVVRSYKITMAPSTDGQQIYV